MVHLSLLRLIRTPKPDRWWRRKFVFDQTGHFYGRRKNCFRVAVIAMRKAWKDMQRSRHLRRREMSRLFNLRISAAAVEHGMRYSDFIGNLPRHNIILDRKILSQLAITEPKTFQCLCDLAKVKHAEEAMNFYRQNPEKLKRMTTQDDLLSEAMAKLSVDKSSSSEQLSPEVSQTGRETAV